MWTIKGMSHIPTSIRASMFFKVKASNNDRVWNETGVSIKNYCFAALVESAVV